MTDLEITLAAMDRHHWRLVLLPPASKRPLGRWRITEDGDTVAHHVTAGGNIGLLCHQDTGVAVLDPDVMGPWADLVDMLGQPAEPWVLTGSGRLHYYIESVPDLPAKIMWCGVVIGEIQRGPGQQMVVMPPSVHPVTRRRYRWITELVNPAVAPLPPLPGLWLAYLRHVVYARQHGYRLA